MWVGLGTQSDLAPSSDRAERRVDTSDAPRIIIRHHSIHMTVPSGDLEALECHFSDNGFGFFCLPDIDLTGTT